MCADKWLSASTLEEFSHAHQVPIEQWTYATQSEFLKQMANADGRIDVICTSSFLLRSLIRTHWIKRLDYLALSNAKLLSVDFLHLPFDATNEYSLPIFWTLYGFFGRSVAPQNWGWKQTWISKKILPWGEELNLLQTLGRMGFEGAREAGEGESKHVGHPSPNLNEQFKQILRSGSVLTPQMGALSAESMTGTAQVDWWEVPLSHVARLLDKDSPFHFWLPEDGAPLEVGVLAVGEKADQPGLAMELINALLAPTQALETVRRLDVGGVETALNSEASLAEMQRPRALRNFQLNRLQFPDLDVESLPRFQRAFDEVVRKTARH